MPAFAIRSLALVVLVASALTAQAQAPAANPATPVPSDVQDLAARLTWWGDLDALERLYAGVTQPGRYTALGTALVSEFRAGTARSFISPRDTGEAYAVEVDALTLEWVRQRPQSPLVHWLRAQSLVKRAWEIRGTGFANTVAPSAWAEFRRHLESAVQHLANSAAVSLQDSSSHIQLVDAGRGLGWELDRVEKLVGAGLKRNPEDLVLWEQLLVGSLPKWGGSTVQVDRLIRRAAEQYPERIDEIYARLYFAAADEGYSHSLFADTAADWPRIRKGLRDAIARWPGKAVYWNRLAYFACLKEDRDTLNEALEAIQNKPDLEQWGRNARRVFEGCQKLGRQG